MVKCLLFIGVSLLLVGCGQRSEIKSRVEAKTIAELYGDGEYTKVPLVLPLSDQELSSFDSPLGKIGFIAGGFAKMFMNLGASLGMGKMRMTLTQQVPQIPADYFKGAKVKRIFFYIEPVKKDKREMSWYQRYFLGRENVDFAFINRIAIKIASHHVENTGSWTPVFEHKTLLKHEYNTLAQVFDPFRAKQVEETMHEAGEKLLVKFDRSDRDAGLVNDSYGKVYIFNTHQAFKTRRFLTRHPKLLRSFKRIHTLNKSILVELKADPVVEESFKVVLAESAVELERLGVSQIEPCSKETCLDFRVPDTNLVPIIMKDNAIKLDAFIEAAKVPDSFQLKGFVEFEIKLKLTF